MTRLKHVGGDGDNDEEQDDASYDPNHDVYDVVEVMIMMIVVMTRTMMTMMTMISVPTMMHMMMLVMLHYGITHNERILEMHVGPWIGIGIGIRTRLG